MKSDLVREAACACQQVIVRTSGEPVRISVCHCLDCQRRTGSAFGAQARFALEAVEVVGETRQYTRLADSGNRVTFRFCPNCGSTVCYQLEAVPGVVAVPLGAFADPAFPGPKVSVYEARKHAWVGLADDIEHIQ